MDHFKDGGETVKINYRVPRNRYLILTGKTGYPSAEFRCRSNSGVVVHETRQNTADQ